LSPCERPVQGYGEDPDVDLNDANFEQDAASTAH